MDSTEQFQQLRSELKTISKRLTQIERKQSESAKSNKRIESKVGTVEENTIWSALIADLVLCGVCAGLSFGVASIDWIKHNGCELLPSWGRAAVPFSLCSGDRPVSSNRVSPGTYAGVSLDREQVAIANQIIEAGHQEGMSQRDIKIALMAALQESSLRNLEHGDDWHFQAMGWGDTSDSVGIFQQRDKWGSRSDRLNPKQSAVMFYRALKQVANRNNLLPGDAAQAVQNSAYPRHYDKWEPVAIALLESGKPAFIQPAQGIFTSPYGMRINPVTGLCRLHAGVDIAAPIGTPVKASAGGVVVTAGDAGDGYGLKVIVEHSDGYSTLYGHNSRLMVKLGQRVSQGEAIALLGSTGNSTGPHLHFEILKNDSPRNPAGFITITGSSSNQTNCN